MSRSQTISVPVEDDVRSEIIKDAKKEKRSMAKQAEYLLVLGLKAYQADGILGNSNDQAVDLRQLMQGEG